MVSAKITVTNATGLHLRPAGTLCDTAMQFQSLIQIKKNQTTANAKSLLAVLAAGVRFGEEIEIICDGDDEELALQTLLALVESKFEE